MQLGNAVDLMAGSKAEICHADLIVCDHCHIVDLCPIAGISSAQFVHKTAVDLLTDGVYTGKLLAEQIHIPALQCLAHNRMVGVGQGLACDLPRLIPAIFILIDQNPHQFRNAKRRMRIVDVNSDLVCQIVKGMVFLIMLFQNALQRSRDQQILLLQTQTLALNMVVCRIKHLGNRLCHCIAFQCADIITAGEGCHVKALRQFGAPKNQAVHALTVISGDKQIMRHGNHRIIADLCDLELSVVHPLADLAAETDLDRIVFSRTEPDIAHFEPVIREFHLPAIDDLLAENAEFIADGVTGNGIAQSGRGIHIA